MVMTNGDESTAWPNEQLDRILDDAFSIVHLTELIANSYPDKRMSDVSNALVDISTPTSLVVDLDHYKELFSKLRFSYVEQVTKEKFIRFIVGDPPLIISPHENSELESHNESAKEALNSIKVEVDTCVVSLERLCVELSKTYPLTQSQIARFQNLPTLILALKQRITETKSRLCVTGNDARLALPLLQTADIVNQDRRRILDLDRGLEQLVARAACRDKDVARMEAELHALDVRKKTSAATAVEERDKKDSIGQFVELEAHARWWKASSMLLRYD
jgi:hypothetical protein